MIENKYKLDEKEIITIHTSTYKSLDRFYKFGYDILIEENIAVLVDDDNYRSSAEVEGGKNK